MLYNCLEWVADCGTKKKIKKSKKHFLCRAYPLKDYCLKVVNVSKTPMPVLIPEEYSVNHYNELFLPEAFASIQDSQGSPTPFSRQTLIWCLASMGSLGAQKNTL